MIHAYDIGTTTVQGSADDMPAPFDPATHIPPRMSAADGQEAGFPSGGGRAARSPSKGGYSEATGHLQNAKDGPVTLALDVKHWLGRAAVIPRTRIVSAVTDPTPADRRSPMEHERDALVASAAPDPDANAACRQPLDPAGMIERLRDNGKWLAPEDVAAAADMIEALVAECSREFARGYETGRAVGAVEGKA